MKRGTTVGFVAPFVHGYFWGNILAGALQAAAPRGARIIAIQTFDAGLQGYRDEDFRTPIGWDHFDALVAGQASLPDQVLEDFARTGRPVLTVFRKPEFDCPIVVPDNDGGIALAVDHLVGHGHRDIAFVGRDPADADDVIRFAAYRAAMARHGLTPRPKAAVDWTLDESYDATRAVAQLRAGGRLPAAAVAVTDLVAMALIRSLAEVGVKVPADMAVIGFDDVAEAAACEPPLSTISQSFLVAGATVCNLALDAAEGLPVAPGAHCTPVTFVRRESCGCRPESGFTAAPGAPDEDLIRASLIDGLAEAAHDVRELTWSQRQVLSGVADRLGALLTAVAHGPGTGHADDLRTTTADLRRLVAESPNPLQIVNAVRTFAQALAARLAPDDLAVANRFERLVFDLALLLLEDRDLDVRGRPTVYHDREIQRRYFMIGTDLVRQPTLAGHSLEWLADTEFRTGCLGLWDGRPGSDTLRVVSTYDRAGRLPALPETCAVSAFPPLPLVGLADEQGDDFRYVYVLPVRFAGSDWGFLALAGPLDPRAEAAFERYNHWAVLMAVALTNEQAIHSEKTLLDEIRTSEERYALAAEAANDGLWDWDLASGTVFYSSRWKALLGCADHEITTKPDEWISRVHPEDRAAVHAMLSGHLSGRTPTTELEHRLRAADGSYRWMLNHGRSMCDDDGQVIRLVGSITDITDRKLLEGQLRHDAYYDQLTGLPNRSLFLERLEQAVRRAERQSGYLFAVVFLDLDGFKLINDSLGHQVGDQVLVHVAERLAQVVRRNDLVSRFGGDEFVLLLEDLDDPGAAQNTVVRVLSVISAPIDVDGRTLAVSSAAGIATSATGHHTADEYLRDADTAMYRAKAAGSGSYVLFDGSMHAGVVQQLQLESDLRQAIEGGQFDLHYQPILRLHDRRTVGTEALIRWQHPRRGMISPNDFLPAAESTGLIRDLGHWTIEAVARQARAWLDDNPAWGDLAVSVNLSNRQFWDPELRTFVNETLEKFAVPSSMVIFEITEGVIMHNQDVASTLMRQLNEDGFKLHLDDFGTGYSSLAALHRFPLDALKIDRSFVSRMRTDPRSRKLVRLMIAMGLDLGIQVIAEGIETEEEAAALAELGCSYVQGYLFSRPLPAAEVTRHFPAHP
ncbi:hypothetical protein Asp14428_00200 [Actinoplanes sp. NBRC 14428]|uniref:PAS domain S-box-containing protein/diguanylate cyclase (GGDEF)-like protein n=1 Tax=Pseudosporangium ferrugineum TaxID=439699 RepID=A0A2T0SJ72_9ACTN|nr:EAL domain-containing protein [Pseudosporangium ferrugineum]PRY33454.1 PAS domain S-box-containing protein/diguanylate cyclase (GGDEF)-like protein [Pseudosporangium ferrugineum]BCJ48545.1 hypothetical protein Asp14428_00200 [Actinoplanes sp. NBRC 14428]